MKAVKNIETWNKGERAFRKSLSATSTAGLPMSSASSSNFFGAAENGILGRPAFALAGVNVNKLTDESESIGFESMDDSGRSRIGDSSKIDNRIGDLHNSNWKMSDGFGGDRDDMRILRSSYSNPSDP